jgi:hypothetical protein
MPEEALDLWPAIEKGNTRTPVSILKQQAALLGKHTKNLLEASVDTDASPGRFAHRFIIEAPALGGYRYELFSIQHDEKLYPVKVISAPPGTPIQDEIKWRKGFESEETFVDWLKAALNSADTKRLLSNLLAQIES